MTRKRALKAHARNNNVFQLERALVSNGRAWETGPTKRKSWSKHDLKVLKPITPPLREMYEAFFNGQSICAHGTAGTGKTMAAIWLGMNEILNQESEVEKLILVRSAVPGREQGFLPGTEEEKMAAYEKPYGPIFAELFGRTSTYADMKEAGLVEFESTSFARGQTWDNAIVVIDEGQNMNFEEINTIMTRLGKNSRMIFAGDLPQKDLRKRGDESGFPKALRVMERTGNFTAVKFTRYDILRSGFVKAWITAVEDDDQYGPQE